MASFTCSFSNITETSANFQALFTGGDSSYTRLRYVLLTIDEIGEWQIPSSSVGGANSSFSRTISGLHPNVTYYWSAQLGYLSNDNIVWSGYFDSGSFTTDKQSLNISPWSWTSSNGSATASQTISAYNVLMGTDYADNFNHRVWNDLVNKVAEMKGELYVNDWDVGGGKYITKEECYVSKGDTLSAEIYNAVKYNIGSTKSTGIQDVSVDDKLTGYHIIHLTDILNEIIENE